MEVPEHVIEGTHDRFVLNRGRDIIQIHPREELTSILIMWEDIRVEHIIFSVDGLIFERDSEAIDDL